MEYRPLGRTGDQERIDALVPPSGVAVRYYDRASGLDLRPHLQRVT